VSDLMPDQLLVASE